MPNHGEVLAHVVVSAVIEGVGVDEMLGPILS